MRRIFILLGIIVLLLWWFLPKKQTPYPRETFILVGSPTITILSWNPRDNKLTHITLPDDVAAEGTHGYGTYSLSAFWRLGEIDKKDGTVLAESVSEALGVPITGYIEDSGNNGLRLFSLGSLASHITGQYRTNIPIPTFMRYVWLLQFSKPDRVDSYDVVNNPARIAKEVQRADGTTQFVIDPARVDVLLAHVFEDEFVRRETVSVSVLNTTVVPFLGNRVARLLSNVGIAVVAVSNDTPLVATCTISGIPRMLETGTARVIMAILGCTPHEVGETERADLVVRVGSDYEKRFMPNAK